MGAFRIGQGGGDSGWRRVAWGQAGGWGRRVAGVVWRGTMVIAFKSQQKMQEFHLVSAGQDLSSPPRILRIWSPLIKSPSSLRSFFCRTFPIKRKALTPPPSLLPPLSPPPPAPALCLQGLFICIILWSARPGVGKGAAEGRGRRAGVGSGGRGARL